MQNNARHITVILLILLVIIGLIVGYFMKNRTISIHTNDDKTTTTLPDSTVIILAPQSSLKYPRKFKKRTIEITNRAYIEVNQNSEEPIFLENDYLKIELGGSRFSINFDEEKEEYSVIAISGEAMVEVKNASGQSVATIQEGDEMRFNAAGSILQVVENTDPNYMAWQTETITFNNHTLEQVIQSLHQHFDKNLKVNNNNLKNCTVSGQFPAQMDSIVTRIAQQLNAKVEETDRSYILIGKGCLLADEY